MKDVKLLKRKVGHHYYVSGLSLIVQNRIYYFNNMNCDFYNYEVSITCKEELWYSVFFECKIPKEINEFKEMMNYIKKQYPEIYIWGLNAFQRIPIKMESTP